MVAVMRSATSRGGSGYLCYLLLSSTSKQRTYVGVTNDVNRRLRQHNGCIVGGAKATRNGRPWNVWLTVEGFPTQKSSLQFEYMWKHMTPRKSHGKKSRLSKLHGLLNKEQWTKQAPLASSIPLTVNIRQIPEEESLLLEFVDKKYPEYVNIHVIQPDEEQQQQQVDDDDDDDDDSDDDDIDK